MKNKIKVRKWDGQFTCKVNNARSLFLIHFRNKIYIIYYDWIIDKLYHQKVSVD